MLRIFVTLTIAFTLAAPALASGIALVSDPGSAPAETLPRNKALETLRRQDAEKHHQAELAYIRSQRGSAYFAYVPMPAMDRNGTTIVDPKSHRPIMDGFCIVWRPNELRDNANLPMFHPYWYTGFSFHVDPGRGELQLYQVSMPNGVERHGGFHKEPGEASLLVNKIVDLTTSPSA